MFNLFKRKYISKTEASLLRNIFYSLGAEFSDYCNQIDRGLLKGVFFQEKPFSNYIGFTYDTTIVNDFENKNGNYFVLRGIRVFDKKQDKYIELRIYISFGLIVGYSTPDTKNPEFDISNFHVKKYTKQIFKNEDYEKISSLIDNKYLKLINPAEVYELEISGSIFYHIKDIGDGDFIGIGLDKNIYRITHDPFEIEKISYTEAGLSGGHVR
jgi:hypothetical protein